MRDAPWHAARWGGIALLVASGGVWLLIVTGLPTAGSRGHSVGALLGGTTVLTTPLILFGAFLVRAGTRRKSATIAATARLMHAAALAPIRGARSFGRLLRAIPGWMRAGGPAAATQHAACRVRSEAASARVALRQAVTALSAIRRDHRERRERSLEAQRRARTGHVPPLVPDGRDADAAGTTGTTVTLAWLLAPWPVGARPPASVFVVHTRLNRRITTGIGSFVATGLAVLALSGNGVWALAMGTVVGLQTWISAWQEIAEVRFEPGLIRFVAPMREVTVLPGGVIEIRRKGSDDSEGDNRHLSVITASDALRIQHHAGIEDLEACLRMWNPEARLTGSW